MIAPHNNIRNISNAQVMRPMMHTEVNLAHTLMERGLSKNVIIAIDKQDKNNVGFSIIDSFFVLVLWSLIKKNKYTSIIEININVGILKRTIGLKKSKPNISYFRCGLVKRFNKSSELLL